MGTEVLHPLQDCFINLAPVIVTKHENNNVGYHTPPEKMGSASRRELNLKLDCDNNDDNSYAGSGFFHSPSPKSLPFPSFFNKKQDSMAMVADHEATKHLCRLLRLR
ncbi:hypothetical protein L1987_26309 [Smallanthus sonchifolius]|uniref:Uncharacterized protein n=1 Tax=Smallanthus sonchifolius TaxID=185202 RepID=A0ACB9I9F2_9ASTR|nr:hypothetical protein L1987_26309 [Smallanthus sonchifolius]